jgi:hypothetical protein
MPTGPGRMHSRPMKRRALIILLVLALLVLAVGGWLVQGARSAIG